MNSLFIASAYYRSKLPEQSLRTLNACKTNLILHDGIEKVDVLVFPLDSAVYVMPFYLN